MLELFGRERARLVEDRLAGPDLPDVVQLPAQPDLLQRITREPENRRRLYGVPTDAGRMAAGVGILGFERLDQHLHAVDQRLFVAPIQLAHPALEILLIES